MFTKPVALSTLLGFGVQVDFSWIVLLVLITWTLGQGRLPAKYEARSAETDWRMGIAGMTGVVSPISKALPLGRRTPIRVSDQRNLDFRLQRRGRDGGRTARRQIRASQGDFRAGVTLNVLFRTTINRRAS